MAKLTHLLLVPGHAVWNLREDPTIDSSWFLKPYQNAEPRYFLQHIQAGVELAAADESALLMFAGGATEEDAGPLTEALGYWGVADWFVWWGHKEVRQRTYLEEYSLDSFLNLEYSLHRFRQITGEWPERITVCGWGFKAHRIAELHRRALGWVLPFEYLAVNDPRNLEEVKLREEKTCAEFAADPRGDCPPIADKRKARDHFRRVPPYDLRNQGWRPVRLPGELW